MTQRDCRSGAVVAVLVCGLALASAGASPAQDTTRAWVLDSGSNALIALELPSGRPLGSLTLPGTPSALAQSPDGSRLVVFDRGPGEDKHERGYKATGRSSLTIVDAASLGPVGRVELGNGLGRWVFSPDGQRLTVWCQGYEAKDAAEALPAELVNVDLPTARETGRLALEPGSLPIFDRSGRMVTSADGRSLPLLQGLPRSAHFPYPQSKLWIVDLARPSIRAKLEMGALGGVYTDGRHFYLLDPGKPDKNPQKNRNGSIEVASMERGDLVGRTDAGREPRGLVQDELGGLVFVLADGPSGASGGELRVLRDGALVATLTVAANPRLIERKQDTVFVVGEREVTLVDPNALSVAGTVPLFKGGEAIVDDHDVATELKTSADGSRAFILYGLNNKVAVLDVEHRAAVGSTKTGRGGKKLFGNLMGGMFGIAGYLAAGYSPWFFTTPSMLAVRPDGAFAYAINMQTKDVTIVDGQTGRSVEIIGGGGYRLDLLRDGQMVAETAGSDLRFIDAQRNAKAAEVPLPDLRGFFPSPDGAVAVALAKQTVVVFDGATGKEISRPSGFATPAAIVFDQRK
jgi:DNA-binding beta-propeller fold protein YncE